MALFDFIQDAGEKFDRERQQQLTEKREAAEAQAKSEQAAEAAQAQQAQAEYDAMVAEGLWEHASELGLAVDEVQIAFVGGPGFTGGTATLTGAVPDAEARDKIVLAVGNMVGVAGVDDQLQFPPAPDPVFYTVEKGDNLSKISTRFYGKGRYYTLIFEANKPMLKDPNKIYPGQVLRIPDKKD